MKRFLSLLLTLALALSLCGLAQADDLPTITIMFHGSNVTDDSAVLEKVNEYIADKVGAKLEVIWGTWGDFDEKAANALNTGDSDVDMMTGGNAGVMTVGVTWGFRSREELSAHFPDSIVDSPADLLPLFS